MGLRFKDSRLLDSGLGTRDSGRETACRGWLNPPAPFAKGDKKIQGKPLRPVLD